MQMTRRMFAGGALMSAAALAAKGEYIVYIGTFTASRSKGIYAFRAAGGKFTPLGVVAETPSPAFLAIHPDGKHLYAANEVSDYNGEKAGSVTAFSIDRATARLTKLNTVSSKGPGPCYVSVDNTGKNVLLANYAGGSAAVLPISADGQLREASTFFKYTGSSVHKRQGESHAHCVKMSPDNKFALVSDLGTDQLRVYHLDAAKGVLTPNEPAAANLDPGSGPRHFAFHPRLARVYVICELSSTIAAFEWNAAKGSLTKMQTVSTLPAGFSGENSTAEIVVHPSGKFLYGSNRGHDSIAVFGLDSSGKMTFTEHTSTKGQVPRNFALDPDGALLFAANQKSDNIVIFRVDAATGKLTPTGDVLEVPTPVCVRFL